MGDIYGADYKQEGLDKDLIAASFSRITGENSAKIKIESITKSFAAMLAISIG